MAIVTSPPSPPPLHHRYFLARHGESMANVLHIISSRADIGCTTHGLTLYGREQVREAAHKLRIQLEAERDTRKIIIIASDFMRTKQTAEIIRDEVKQRMHGDIRYDTRLRERYFGEIDGQNEQEYKKVWEKDAQSAEHSECKCESVASVANRTMKLVEECEKTEQEKIIVMVSHGDTLQIMQTMLLGMPGTMHRTLPYLDRAEIREVHSTEK